jgi:DNA-directed RNA polymerase specialized sigma24 family protein
LRTARRHANSSDVEDVVSETRAVLFERLQAGESITHVRSYCVKVARSIIRKLRRQSLPRADAELSDILTTDLPTRTPFDELTAEVPPSYLPRPTGRTQSEIERVVRAGSNLDSITNDRKRLAKLRFLTNERANLIRNLRKTRDSRCESESSASTIMWPL